MNLAERLKKIREQKGLSKIAFAKSLNVNVKTYSSYENGRSTIDSNLCEKLQVNFNISLDWLISGHGNMYINKESNQPEHMPVTVQACIRIMKDEYNISEEDMNLIVDEFLTKNATKETILALLKAKKGNKTAVQELEKIIIGLKMAYE